MEKTAVSVATLYAFFAAFSISTNIGMQMLSVWAYGGPYSVEVSIVVATIVGLPLRYLLEKRYIFEFKSDDLAHDGKLLAKYTSMSVFTTLIFWVVEYSFHLLFSTDTMRYFGALVGLTIGFYIKYQLDKRYVFLSNARRIAT